MSLPMPLAKRILRFNLSVQQFLAAHQAWKLPLLIAYLAVVTALLFLMAANSTTPAVLIAGAVVLAVSFGPRLGWNMLVTWSRNAIRSLAESAMRPSIEEAIADKGRPNQITAAANQAITCFFDGPTCDCMPADHVSPRVRGAHEAVGPAFVAFLAA